MNQPLGRNGVEELVQGYLDDALTGEAEERLKTWLESDRAHIEYFTQQLDIHASLWEEFLRIRRTSPVARVPGRSSRRWGMWVSIAACLAIIFGSLVYNHWRSTQFREVLVAHIKATATNVRIIRRGETIIAVVDIGIFVGDRIETGPGRNAAFAYDGEETEILIDENTMLDVGDVKQGKRLGLSAGRIEATVAPQPSGKPMIVTTPQARAEVKGTHFNLRVDPGSANASLPPGERHFDNAPLPPGERPFDKAQGRQGKLGEGESGGILAVRGANTRIDVYKGLVGFTRISDETWVDVPTGHYAIAGTGIELKVLPIAGAGRITPAADAPAHGQGTLGAIEYVDGPVIFKDDFESGLGKWTVTGNYVYPDGRVENREMVKAEHDYVTVVEVEQDGKKTNVARLEGKRFTDYRINFGLQPKGCWQIKSPVVWECDMLLTKKRRGSSYEAITGRLGWRDTHVGTWRHWRQEYLPVAGPMPEKTWRLRSICDGKLEADTFVPADSLLGAAAGSGMVMMIDNCVIRKLVPVSEGESVE